MTGVNARVARTEIEISYSDGRTADFFSVPPFNKRTLPP